MDSKKECLNQEYVDNRILQEDLEQVAKSNLDFNKLKNSTILVTGATGLIGVSVIRSLLCANRLNNLDLRIIAFVRNLEKAKTIFRDLFYRNELEFVLGDITNKVTISQSIEYIIHCASVTTSKYMISNPVETIVTAVDGTKNILLLAQEKKCKSVVYLSSMEVYGSFDKSIEVTENQLGYINPLEIRSNYPESKRLCENMCIAFHTEYNVPVKIARLSQTFGAGILPGENRIFAQFAKSVLEKRDIILHTSGNSEGNYCYISDAVIALLFILLEGDNAQAYNISNPNSHMKIIDMANMVCQEIANGEIKVVFDIADHNKFGYANDTKMKINSDKLQALGWTPQIGLAESYRRMIDSLHFS